MNQSAISDYFYKLDAKLEVRYLKKTAFIRKEDPYALKKDAFAVIHLVCQHLGTINTQTCWVS